ncbi:MAG: DUF1232 domain-containing protein [Clostridia bacterium]|nr:DUF1232 domain-containing protein [Clostridia bacterium]
MPSNDGIINVEKEAESAFNASCAEAEKILSAPDEIEKLLKRLEKKLTEIPVLGEGLAYVPKMGLLIKYYIEGKYTEIPIGTITVAVGAILYFVMPIDIIPDSLPGVGHLDDAAVVGAALLLIKSDIDEFMEWYKNEKTVG